MKSEFEKLDVESRRAAEQELRRSHDLPEHGIRDKWKLRVRILSDSHTIRPKALSTWNQKINWIKLVYVKKQELIVEITLKDNIPIEALWYFGWGIARHFVMALNMGSMGFWWWRLPEQISRYYETLEDLENDAQLTVDRSPRLKVDWGPNRTLTEKDLELVMACFVALPGPEEQERHAAYNSYIGGLTFLSLNDIHWQCESTAFGNFYESLKGMMKEGGDWQESTPFETSFLEFLDEVYPDLDDREAFAKICRSFEDKSLDHVVITLKEVAFMKLFCDAYFMGRLRSARLNELSNIASDESDDESSPGEGDKSADAGS